MNRWLISASLLVIALLGVDFAWHYPVLPADMASHFDAAGKPNDTMSRSVFVAVALTTLAGISGLFALLAYLLPRIPASTINLPHREFWLAATQRSATFVYIRRSFAVLGFLVTAHLAFIFHFALIANLKAPPSLGNEVWVALVIFLAAFTVWIYRFGTHFARPPKPA